ncbi:periplasmic heavy metal sensor [Neptunicoccus sediminis]|uniref:periplasmic heavy metal sensor n=1 Tax=Neptunicoccus sediminis TaxID=1892596 RepID=UPI000846092C|nr:periplasmic heavy metal sensor [Neptunicoccus sediminis]
MTQTTEIRKTRNWGKVALIGSLALNLLVVGLVVGAFGRFDGHAGGRAGMGLGSFIKALPEAEQDMVRAASGLRREDRKKTMQALRASKNALEQALLAQPFNEEAARAAIKAHHLIALQHGERLQNALVKAVADMSPQDHATYVERVHQEQEKRLEREKNR